MITFERLLPYALSGSLVKSAPMATEQKSGRHAGDR